MTTVTNGDAPIARLLDPRALLERKSHFLLGPRQTGKTFLIRQGLPTERERLAASVSHGSACAANFQCIRREQRDRNDHMKLPS